MNGIPTIDPGSGEIQSPLIAGISEGLNKVSSAMNITEGVLTDFQLEEVYITSVDRYRIYQAPNGKRLWDSNIVVKINGVVTSPEDGHFTINYVGGSISFETEHRRVVSDVITVSGNYADVITSGSPAKLGELYITSNKNFSDPNFLLADGSIINQPDFPEYFDVVLDENKKYYADTDIIISDFTTRNSYKSFLVYENEIVYPSDDSNKGATTSWKILDKNGEEHTTGSYYSITKKGENYYGVTYSCEVYKTDKNYKSTKISRIYATSDIFSPILYLPKRDIFLSYVGFNSSDHNGDNEHISNDDCSTWNEIPITDSNHTNIYKLGKSELMAGQAFIFGEYTFLANNVRGMLYRSSDEIIFEDVKTIIGENSDSIIYNIIDNLMYVFVNGKVFVTSDGNNFNRIQNEITETVAYSDANKVAVIGLKKIENKYYVLVRYEYGNYLRRVMLYITDDFDNNTKKPKAYTLTSASLPTDTSVSDYSERTSFTILNNVSKFYIRTYTTNDEAIQLRELFDIFPRIKLLSLDADAIDGANAYVKVLE